MLRLLLSLLLTTALPALAACPSSTPDAEFTDNGDGTVTLARTGLTWQRCPLGQTWSGGTCTGSATTFAWSDALQAAANNTYAGHDDWRLPNFRELYSLIERTCGAGINTGLFPGNSSPAWTSTTYARDPLKAWYVKISYGSTPLDLKTALYAARLVRGGRELGVFDRQARYTPDSFAFADQVDVATNSIVTSAGVTLSGLATATGIQVGNGSYAINGGAYRSTPGAAVNGDVITLRHVSAATEGTGVTTTLIVGGVSASFRTTTRRTTVAGACGSAAGNPSAFAPDANLCASGSPGAVAAGSPWTWSCNGVGGGGSAQCSAPNQSLASGGGARTVVSGGSWAVDATRSAGFIATSGHAKSPSDLPAGYRFPYGLLDFTLQGAGAGASIAITYPGVIPADAVYWKYGPSPAGYDCAGAACAAPHWYRMPAGQVAIAGNTITLSIVDGGVGDDDLTANGVIVDAGGPGIPGGVADIPSLSEWGVLLLSLLLSGAVKNSILDAKAQRRRGKA